VRKPPDFPLPGRAIRCLMTPPPRSASIKPRSALAIASHSVRSSRPAFRANLVNGLFLNIRICPATRRQHRHCSCIALSVIDGNLLQISSRTTIYTLRATHLTANQTRPKGWNGGNASIADNPSARTATDVTTGFYGFIPYSWLPRTFPGAKVSAGPISSPKTISVKAPGSTMVTMWTRSAAWLSFGRWPRDKSNDTHLHS